MCVTNVTSHLIRNLILIEIRANLEIGGKELKELATSIQNLSKEAETHVKKIISDQLKNI